MHTITDPRRPPTTSHNFVAKTRRLLEIAPPQPGTVLEITIAHDDWCDALHGRGFCNCDPLIRLIDLTGEANRN